MLKLARAVNPSPAMLVISNPKGAKRMAAKKATRKTSASRKAPVKAKAARKNPTLFKKRTATKRASVKRRSNPGITSGLGTTAMQAINTVLGMTALGVVSPMLPQVLGPTPIGRAAQIGGLGWLGGYGLKRFGFGKAGDAMQLGGAVLGASILIESYVAPMIRGIARPAATPQSGMQGIAVVGAPFAPPALPAAPVQAPQQRKPGMQGIAAYPRMY